MKGKLAILAFGLVLTSLVGCANDDELLAEKERTLNERVAENDKLRREVADKDSTQAVIEKQLQNHQGEAQRVRGENSSLRNEKTRLEEENRRLQESARALAQAPPPAAVPAAPAGPDIRLSNPNLEVEKSADGAVIVRLPGQVSFTPGSADLSKGGAEILKEVATEIKRHEIASISVEGHTDDTPLKRTAARWKTNMNLSLARAIAVQRSLEKMGIEKERIRVVGYGSTKPLVSGDSKEMKARNRRVEIVLFGAATN